jgi:AraC-like DNA-binding protein
MSQKRRGPADEPFPLVRTSVSDHRAAGRIDAHSHDWHQLVYISRGLMTVTTDAGSWVAPPDWAIWVPAGLRHAIRFVIESSLRTAYLRTSMRENVPSRCGVIRVTPLLRELVLRTTELGMHTAIATLLVAELQQTGVASFGLPQPRSEIMQSVARLVVSASGDTRTLAALARSVGMSKRTLERRLSAESGMTVGRWRQQHLLLHALERLAAGEPISRLLGGRGTARPARPARLYRRSGKRSGRRRRSISRE